MYLVEIRKAFRNTYNTTNTCLSKNVRADRGYFSVIPVRASHRPPAIFFLKRRKNMFLLFCGEKKKCFLLLWGVWFRFKHKLAANSIPDLAPCGLFPIISSRCSSWQFALATAPVQKTFPWLAINVVDEKDNNYELAYVSVWNKTKIINQTILPKTKIGRF